MKLSISNIAWDENVDETVYTLMKKYGFDGLEIAPTRIFPENPYDHLDEAAQWAASLKKEYGFMISSMQSIWYGKTERIFGSEQEREILLDYTKKAILFAERIGCHNLVFGCPRNRSLQSGEDERIAIPFFRELGDYAAVHGTVLAMEANPPIYNTNYINDTAAALNLVKQVGSRGFLLNLDVGTMIQNGEKVSVLDGNIEYINHVHISEPGLKPPEERLLHEELMEYLCAYQYGGFVSVEMGRANNTDTVENVLIYSNKLLGRVNV
ncbi:MAG: sugar phosphate isomerase/epimerase [Lachnospiraceae bacterium]|nr:sugar phosphate isomerase/epimerase [Lachnospiraceae bacterium]